ncbi:ATP-binding protein [uncultured Microbulbifer sp.]|uniref:ATP-binding protein n=1 Tax=uncultured Microbulbifer sp. TaxID=348147 RepID=UPI0026068449|nr:ATP-binding protein [uncultured Microbulbifer sp.]
MSNVNIKRAIDNIRSGTSVYTPIVEVIVNAIQAIESTNMCMRDGLVDIAIKRARQIDLVDSIPEVEGFEVVDNGIGFTDQNRDSFDTLYSAHKIAEGGKGFGRFTCLKYFEDMEVESSFQKNGKLFDRSFKMGKENEIIINEKKEKSNKNITGSKIKLLKIKKKKFPEKKIQTIARILVERLLPFFVNKDRIPPKIVLREEDESEVIILNEYVETQSQIQEINSASSNFCLERNEGEERFIARVFKFYSPRSQTSKVSLVAHRREVTSVSLHKYIPEFIEEFYDRKITGEEIAEKNFTIKVYVFGEYLDENVSLERGGFEFQKENDVIYGISQVEIEKNAAELARSAVNSEVQERYEKKKKKVKDYVNEQAPWHKGMLSEIDLTDMPYNATNEQIETKLQKKKYEQEIQVRGEVSRILGEGNLEDLKENASDIVRRISGSTKNDLAHYIALRRSVIDLFDRSLQVEGDGSYSSEGVVHDIIFPRRGDSDTTAFEEHNLWLIDERLNFTEYLSSDLPLKGRQDRPDLLAYDSRVVFRGENEATNPVTIFEFKKPQRDDFVNPSSNEDPVQQVVRYVRRLRSGDFKTPQGREILISENTPFYGFVVCDLAKKVRSWLEEEKDFKPMPDRLGYFQRHENLNLYIEVIGWDKVLKDASMRSRIFFHKLGIV